MKYGIKFLVLILFAGYTPINAQQNNQTEVSKFIVSDVYGNAELNPWNVRGGVFNDFKTLAPNSVLLKNDFKNYFGLLYNYSFPDNVFSVLAGIKFRDKQKTFYRTNPELRLGVSYYSGVGLNYELMKMDSKRYDTLISSQTGQTTYLDSDITRSYNMNYSSKQLRIDASLILRSEPWKRLTIFTGTGITAGMSFSANTDIYYIETDDIISRDSVNTSRNGAGGSFIRETFKNKNNFGFSAFIPAGIDFRIGKKREFLKRMHIYFEARPSVNIISIPELRTYAYTSIPLLLGLKLSLNPAETTGENNTRDTTKINQPKKNEIAIKIQPALYYMLGGNNYQYMQNGLYVGTINLFGIDNRNTVGILYKHYFNRSGIRVGLNYNRNKFKYYYSSSGGINNSNFAFPNGITFSTQYPGFFETSLVYSLYSNCIAGISIGYEYVMGKKKLKHFVGCDVNGSVYSISEKTEKQYWQTDTIAAFQYYSHVYRTDLIGTHNSTLFKIGFAPFYGIKYFFSNRISMSLQTGFEQFFVKGKIKLVDDKGNEYFQTVKQSDIYSQSVISDISISYRF